MTSSSTRATGFVAPLLPLFLLAAALTACGGGAGTATDSALPTGSTLTAAEPPPALVAGEATMPHSSSAGSQTLQTLGSLADGGHAVAWLSTAAQGPVLQVQRFDGAGRRLGGEAGIPLDASMEPRAVALLPDGSVVLAFVTMGPATREQPWITRTAVVVRRYDTDGLRVGADMEVAAVEQDRIDPQVMRYLDAPALARWDDGGFVLAWTLVEEDTSGKRPRFWAQRFGREGQPAGAPQQVAAAELDTAHRVIAAAGGGWILVTEHRVMGRAYVRYHGRDGAAVPALPGGAMGFAEGSLLVPLYGGRSLLVAPVKNYGAWQLYGADGQPVGPGGTLQQAPVAATALRDGGWVLFEPGTTTGSLQAVRFDPTGRPAGPALGLQARPPLQGVPLADGGVAIGWDVSGRDGLPDVMTQRLR